MRKRLSERVVNLVERYNEKDRSISLVIQDVRDEYKLNVIGHGVNFENYLIEPYGRTYRFDGSWYEFVKLLNVINIEFAPGDTAEEICLLEGVDIFGEDFDDIREDCYTLKADLEELVNFSKRVDKENNTEKTWIVTYWINTDYPDSKCVNKYFKNYIKAMDFFEEIKGQIRNDLDVYVESDLTKLEYVTANLKDKFSIKVVNDDRKIDEGVEITLLKYSD